MVKKAVHKKVSSLSNLYVEMLYFHDINCEHKIKKNKYVSFALVANGSVETVVSKQTTKFESPYIICIPPNKEMIIVPLEEDTVVYNIHALRDNSGDVIDPSSIPNGVDLEELGLSKELLEYDRSN